MKNQKLIANWLIVLDLIVLEDVLGNICFLSTP